MSLKPKSVILLLVWCLFMGVTAISIGVGALFPALNQIAGPFICSNGQMRVDSQTYNGLPGQTVTTLDWQCVDKQTGEAQPVNEMSMFLINGLIYGFILFVVVVIGVRVAAKRRPMLIKPRSSDHVEATLGDFTTQARQQPRVVPFDNPEADELRKLKNLREAGLITEQDYEQKKAEILSRL